MKKNIAIVRFILALLIILEITPTSLGQQQSTISDDAAASRIAWWRDAKFGLFMHWGVYSIPGRGEWVQWDEQIPVNEYAKLAGQFLGGVATLEDRNLGLGLGFLVYL